MDTMDYKRFLPKYFSTCSIIFFIFSKGSIVAEFKLRFHKNDEPKEAFEMLKKEISDGNLGTLQVDPLSLEQIVPATKGDFILLFLLFWSMCI